MSSEAGRKSRGNISQRTVRDEYDISSLSETTPPLRRRSRILASLSPSPVFTRKAVLSNGNRKAAAAGGSTGRKAWPSFVSGSPILGSRKLPPHQDERVAVTGCQRLFTDDSPKSLPLRERKNVADAGRAGSKSSTKKTSIVPDTMSKENVQPVRKSARTKKVPARFIECQLPGKEVSAKKNNKKPDIRGVDLQTDFKGTNGKEKLNKLPKSDASKKGIPSSRGNKGLIYDNPEKCDDAVVASGKENRPLEPAKGSSQESLGNITMRRKPRIFSSEGHVCPSTTKTRSDFAIPKNSECVYSTKFCSGKKKAQNSVLEGVDSSKEKEGPKSHSTTRTTVEGKIPSESNVLPQSSEHSIAATPRLSKRETLRQMILNGTLPIRETLKGTGPCGTESDSVKKLNSTGTYLSGKSYTRRQKSPALNPRLASAPKRRELPEVPPKETIVRTSSRSRNPKNKCAVDVTVQGEVCNTLGKENADLGEVAAAARKRLRKPKANTTETENTGASLSAAKKDGVDKVTPFRPDESIPKRQGPGSGNLGLAKKKLPVWVAESGTPTVGRRMSVRRKSNMYDFSASPVKKGTKKPRRQYRPRARTKDPKQKCKLKSVLVTDPQWKNPLAMSGTSSSVGGGAGSESVRSATSAEKIFDDEFYAQMNSAVSEDYGSDRDVCERDEGNIFEMFEGETASSFIPSQGENSSAVPMVSCSGRPTPSYRKQPVKYLGSSTPRADTLSFVPPPEQSATVEDDIAKCFGFENDDDDDDNDGLSLNLSPVRQSGQQSRLNLTINSEIMTSINQSSASQPYRFSWGVMRPGNFSYTSSRSSSMIVHGRSTNKSVSSSMSSVSVSSLPSMTSRPQRGRAVTAVRGPGRAGLVAQRRLKEKPQARPATKNNVTEGAHDVSVLFDEEDEGNTEACVAVSEVAPVKHYSGNIRPYLTGNCGQESLEKSVNKRPRKSYERQALLEAKKKFEKEFGGVGTTTEAETEEDLSMQPEPPKRKKRTVRKKLTKKPKVVDSHDDTTEGSQASGEAETGDARRKKRRGPNKKKDDGLDKSIHDWASGVNSHFSEIEDSELVVM